MELAARVREGPRRAALDCAAADAITALSAFGVDVLLLKGAALAQALYAPDRERTYYDVDLLVAPASVASAAKVLSELGYRNITSAQGIDDIAGHLHAELWTRLDRTRNISIDLHRRVPGCNAPPETIWRVLRDHAQPIQVHGHPALTLSTSGLALHAALHLAQHGQSDVKAVSDLRLGLARWPEDVWQGAAQLARELEGVEAFSAGLRLLPEGEALAVRLRLGSGDQARWDLEHRDARPRGTFHVEALRQAETTRERIAIVRKSVLPSPNWIRWEMRWAANGRVRLAAAYLLHLSRAPLWAVRAIRFNRHRRRR